MDEDVRVEDPFHPLNVLDFKPILGYIPANATLLDVGCGKGTWLLFLKHYRPDVKAKGIDVNPEYVEICRAKGLDVELGDIYSLSFARRSFDVVTCMHVLEHLEDDRAALMKLIDVARLRVILVLPRFYLKLYQWRSAFQEHFMVVYTPRALKRLLKGLKAEVKEHYSVDGEAESWLVVVDVS